MQVDLSRRRDAGTKGPPRGRKENVACCLTQDSLPPFPRMGRRGRRSVPSAGTESRSGQTGRGEAFAILTGEDRGVGFLVVVEAVVGCVPVELLVGEAGRLGGEQAGLGDTA